MTCPTCGKSVVTPMDVPDQICDECKGILRLQEVAEILGGGWKMQGGYLPTVILTLDEAEAIVRRLHPNERTVA